MSVIRASSQPPPRACPETAAMMGVFIVVVSWDLVGEGRGLVVCCWKME